MTRNQVEALKLQEEKRRNRVRNAVDIASVPIQFLSSIGTVARGLSGFKDKASLPKLLGETVDYTYNDNGKRIGSRKEYKY